MESIFGSVLVAALKMKCEFRRRQEKFKRELISVKMKLINRLVR